MAKITNLTKTPRGINVRGGGDTHIGVTVAPGQTLDAELFDPGNKVYHGWQDAGLMDFGDALIPPGKAAEYHQAKGDNMPPAPAKPALSASEIEAEIERRVQVEKDRLAAEAAAAEAAKKSKA